MTYLAAKLDFWLMKSIMKKPQAISPKTTICSWESWDTISIPKVMLKKQRKRVNKLEQKSEARYELELWAEVAQAKYGVTQGSEHTPVTKQPDVPNMETTAVATKTEECDWKPDDFMNFDRRV